MGCKYCYKYVFRHLTFSWTSFSGQSQLFLGTCKGQIDGFSRQSQLFLGTCKGQIDGFSRQSQLFLGTCKGQIDGFSRQSQLFLGTCKGQIDGFSRQSQLFLGTCKGQIDGENGGGVYVCVKSGKCGQIKMTVEISASFSKQNKVPLSVQEYESFLNDL